MVLELRFVNREEELGKLLELSARGFYPVLYVYGPEGCGKTRLLKELYSRVKGREEFLTIYVDAQSVSSVREAVLAPSEVLKLLVSTVSELGGPPGRAAAIAILHVVRKLKAALIWGKHVVILVDDVARPLGLDYVEVFIKNLLNLVEEVLNLGAESVLALATTSEGASRKVLARHNYAVLHQVWNLSRTSFTELLQELGAPDAIIEDSWALLGGNPRLALTLKAMNWSLENLKESLRRRIEASLEPVISRFSKELEEVVEDVDNVLNHPELLNHLLEANLITPVTRPCLGYTPEVDKELGIGRYYAWQVPIYRELVAKHLRELRRTT